MKLPLPNVEFWKSRLALCEPFAICNRPVVALSNGGSRRGDIFDVDRIAGGKIFEKRPRVA